MFICVGRPIKIHRYAPNTRMLQIVIDSYPSQIGILYILAIGL